RLWVVRLPLVFGLLYFTDLGPEAIWYAMLISNIAMIPLGMYLYSRVSFLPKVQNVVSETNSLSAV
ncbi:MAG: hypothetical protein WC888_03490, partial [Candidatus Izemoplasmatales bacterium]